LQIIASREKRKVEKPRLPRTAKKIQTKKMEAQLGQLGLEIEPDEDVSVYIVVFSSLQICDQEEHWIKRWVACASGRALSLSRAAR